MSRLYKNVLYNLLGQGIVLALGFVGVKFIFSRLGADAFGIIFFNQVLTGVLTSALELGVLSTTVREVSAHFESELDYVRQLIRTASVFYWGLGGLLYVAVFLLAPVLVQHWINLKTIDAGTATTMLRVLAITTLIMLPRALYSSIFQGRQRMELNNSIDVGASAAQQLGIIAILAAGGNVFAVVWWIAISAVLSTLTYIAVASRLIGWRSLVPRYFSSVVKRNVRFTAHMSVLSVLNMVQLQFDKIVVSKLLPVASVGYYSFGSTVVIRISFASAAIAQAALPSFSRLHQLGDSRPLLLQYRKLQDLISFGLVPVFAAATFGAMPLYTYLFSRSTASVLLLPTALLCLGFFMAGTINVPYTLAIAMGKPQIASRANVVALFVVLPITALLIYFNGLVGAGSSWVVYYVFLYAYMIPKICRECLGMKTWSWYAHIARVLALAAITYGLVWLLVVVPHSYSTTAIVISYLAASIFFLAGAFLLIGPDLRSTIRLLPQRFILRKATSPS
ncbi:MAG: oligosaccharide flippase family protein [Candidatus Dormibacteraceae bacterium]